MTFISWVDGRLVSPEDPQVSVLDHGLLVGDGVFETCEIVDGMPFALTRHLARLRASARGLGLEPPEEPLVREAIFAVVGAWSEEEPAGRARLRITWTSGIGELGSKRGDGPGTLIVLAETAHEHPLASVHVVPWARNERGALAGIKSISYAENAMALARARSHGATEAIFANTRGELCEGTGTNVFLEREHELVTPPLTSGALAGVTRDLVLEWAPEAGIRIREEALPLSAIYDAQHVALTSSSRGISPVVAVDGEPRRPGPITLRMGEVYAARRAEQVDP